MKNLIGAVELNFDFVLRNQQHRSPEYFEKCLADAVLNYWQMLLFVSADNEDFDDAAKAEEILIDSILNDFSAREKGALQAAAQRRLKDGLSRGKEIDPEDESLNREQRFLTFIATGRFDDMDLL